MSTTATRLITLIMTLQRQPVQKAAGLAARLGVSVCALHRYFDMLDETGISIYAAREQGSKIQDNFYWYWNKSPISSVINHTQHDGSNQATNTQKGGRFDDISQFYLLDAASISGGKSG